MSNGRKDREDEAQMQYPGSPKKLVVCCDGTWMDSASGKYQVPSNVTRFTRAIKLRDSADIEQLVLYQPGVGTSYSFVDHYLGGGTGQGIAENIRQAYSFLALNYAPGDSIFVVGFSRGAFAARCLASLVGQIGLLNRRGMAYFSDIFSDWDKAGRSTWPLADKGSNFLRKYQVEHPHVKDDYSLRTPSNDPTQLEKYLAEYRLMLQELNLIPIDGARIQAVGCWDSVGALGFPTTIWMQRLGIPAFLPAYHHLNTIMKLGDYINNAFQALALDEHRSPFRPLLWEREPGSKTKLKQVWVPGAHTNCGGGASNTTIADLALAWMMDQLAEGGEALQPANPDGNPGPLDWLEFEDKFFSDGPSHVSKDYVHPSNKPWGDANNEIHHSFIFPYSLVGHVNRSPGRYRKTDPYTGLFMDELMHDTEERVHASVRVRVLYGVNRDVDDDGRMPLLKHRIHEQDLSLSPASNTFWSSIKHFFSSIVHTFSQTDKAKYSPPALGGWTLHNGMNDTTPPVWKYQSTDALTLQEDVLGPFERNLIRTLMPDDLANDVIQSNAGSKNFDQLHLHHAPTRANTLPNPKLLRSSTVEF